MTLVKVVEKVCKYSLKFFLINRYIHFLNYIFQSIAPSGGDPSGGGGGGDPSGDGGGKKHWFYIIPLNKT